jgi:hypothetical protein
MLSGAYRETYCVFEIGGGEDGELAECLREAVSELEDVRLLIEELRSTGGSSNFYVSWTAGERGEVFDVSLLSSIAALGIDLGIEPLSAD